MPAAVPMSISGGRSASMGGRARGGSFPFVVLEGIEGGQHEQAERHVRAHRVARQREDRRVIRADRAEALRHAGLHRDLDELHAA